MKARVEELFHEVADLSPDARTRYFAEHDVDQDTRGEVEALLAFDSGATGFLERDIGMAADRTLAQLERTGARCGPYRLLDRIGRGGMGTVYLAERVDGEVTQRVAVKLLQPGAGDFHRERFLQERQILASLSHPNIARLLDAGHLDDGQPFLAMEHVDGKPIDVFAAGLGIRRKIALLVKVSAAVGYLHRNLVVHRDLKPSNILVTGDGEPKLLDFGIAKILDLTTDSALTNMRLLTPDYASPEQVTGGRISTASDIYSLGAVLYRLLTGKPPHEFEGSGGERTESEAATQPVTRPSRWVSELKGDVELILLKALRKDPQERYATAEQFAEDLEAFLESRPVRARSGNAWYRTRKFLRRHWVPVGAAALVIASLFTGLYVANRERVIAQRRFWQLRQLSGKVFELDLAIRDLPGSLEARHRLVSASLEYLEGLGAAANGDLELSQELGEAYARVGRIQGVPTELNLGESIKAEATLKKAADFIDVVLASRPQSRSALLSSASIAVDRMILADSAHHRADALAHAHKAAERLDSLTRLRDLNEKERDTITGSYGNLALAHINMHLYDDGIRYAHRIIDIARSQASPDSRLSAGLSLLASAQRSKGDLEAALQAIREARSIAEKTVYPSALDRMINLYGILLREGVLLGDGENINLNRPAEAILALQKALDLTEEVARMNPNEAVSRNRVGTSSRELGDILRHRDPERALAVYDLGLRRLGEIKSSLRTNRDRAQILAGSSYALRSLHRQGEAMQRIETAFGLLRETKDYPADKIASGTGASVALRALADHHAETGQPEKAAETYRELLGKIMASNPDLHNDLRDAVSVSGIYTALAGVLRRLERVDEAAAIETSRLDLWRHWERKLPNNPFVLRQIAATRH